MIRLSLFSAVSGVSSSRDPDPVSSIGGSNDGLSNISPGVDFDGGMSPMAGVVAGAVGVLLAIVMAAIVVARRRCHGVRRRTPELMTGQGEEFNFQ